MPKVSVIIPTYNRASLLRHAIESVLGQTYDDYELIIVDDGSTDNTAEVVARNSSDKIIYVHQQNRGRSAARNHGIRIATGEYIAFLDSDDMFLSAKLESQVKVLDDNPAIGLVYSHAKNVDENGDFLAYHYEGDFSGRIYPEMLFIKNNLITTPTVMVRASILSEVGGFDETLHICEDLDLWRRIARCHEVAQIPTALALIRIRAAERIDIVEFMKGRTRYYQKAFEEDRGILNIKKALYNEMYQVYLDCAIHYKQYGIALFILGRCLINDPAYAIRLAFNNISRI
jgi:glycosyltransferase involved in cell wall biosynthesis